MTTDTDFKTIATPDPEPAEIPAPASKSLSHRYLIGAALADGESVVRNALDSADVEATRRILCAAGAKMKILSGDSPSASGDWEVRGVSGCPRGGETGPLECDVAESGTTCRLLTAVLAAGKGLFRIFGKRRMSDRPIGELCSVLQSLGCGVEYQEKKGYPPLVLKADRLRPALIDGHARIGMEESSQFFSGLLFAAPLAESPLAIELGGTKTVSWPYLGLTLECLFEFGIRFQVEVRPRIGVPWIPLKETTWRNLAGGRPGCLRVRVWPGAYKAGEYSVEGDWSGASYFLAAGALGRRPTRVIGLRPDSLQGDRAIIGILEKMGAKVSLGKNSVTVYPSELRGVTLDMGDCPDLVPTVAVLAAFAKGSTRVCNVAHLRIKESDRIAAPASELGKLGVMADALSDGLLISGMKMKRGGPVSRESPSPCLPDGECLCSHNDHRMAMSLALLEMRDPALRVSERIDDASVVSKSFPHFWELWRRLQ